MHEISSLITSDVIASASHSSLWRQEIKFREGRLDSGVNSFQNKLKKKYTLLNPEYEKMQRKLVTKHEKELRRLTKCFEPLTADSHIALSTPKPMVQKEGTSPISKDFPHLNEIKKRDKKETETLDVKHATNDPMTASQPRNTSQIDCSQTEQESLLTFGSKVKSWSGGQNELDQVVKQDVQGDQQMDGDDMYNDDFDRPRVKKMKKNKINMMGVKRGRNPFVEATKKLQKHGPEVFKNQPSFRGGMRGRGRGSFRGRGGCRGRSRGSFRR